MRAEKALIRLLNRIIAVIAEEADKNPEFEQKLNVLLEPVAPRDKKKSSVIEEDVPDIYSEWRGRGPEEFHLWLRDQPLRVLRSIIQKHELDPSRRVARWTEPEKLSAFIVDQLQARLARGTGFMRS